MERRICCLQGPRGFPGKDGKQGQPGEPLTNTKRFSSGILPSVFADIFLYLGFGTSLHAPSLSQRPLVNGFQIPIPRNGTLTNFTISVAHNLVHIDPAEYLFQVYRIPSSLDGVPGPILEMSVLELAVAFPATLVATPLQASRLDTTRQVNVLAGDRLAVVVQTNRFRHTGKGQQSFNASFDYTYNLE